jgi:hypothetical protein
MEEVKYFFDCYYHTNVSLDEFDNLIKRFKERESKETLRKLTDEVKSILGEENAERASHILNKKGNFKLSFKKTEIFLKYFYDKLCDQPTEMTLGELIKRLRK